MKKARNITGGKCIRNCFWRINTRCSSSTFSKPPFLTSSSATCDRYSAIIVQKCSIIGIDSTKPLVLRFHVLLDRFLWTRTAMFVRAAVAVYSTRSSESASQSDHPGTGETWKLRHRRCWITTITCGIWKKRSEANRIFWTALITCGSEETNWMKIETRQKTSFWMFETRSSTFCAIQITLRTSRNCKRMRKSREFEGSMNSIGRFPPLCANIRIILTLTVSPFLPFKHSGAGYIGVSSDRLHFVHWLHATL